MLYTPTNLSPPFLVSDEETPFLANTFFKDISAIIIHGLESASYLNKTTSPPSQSTAPASEPLSLTSVTDRVYSSLDPSSPIVIQESGKPKLSFLREGLTDCTVWNPWQEGANGMGDFEPKTAWQEMVCVEPGQVSGWIKLEAGDAWEGCQLLKAE